MFQKDTDILCVFQVIKLLSSGWVVCLEQKHFVSSAPGTWSLISFPYIQEPIYTIISKNQSNGLKLALLS